MYTAVFETIHVAPETQETFSFSKPIDWQLVAPPAEEPNFDEPTYFLPLSVATALYSVAIFSVGARPAPSDISLREWIEITTEAEALRPVAVGTLRGYTFDARHAIGAARVITRTIYIENDGTLYAISAMAAEQAFESMKFLLTEMTESFRFANPVPQSDNNAITDPFMAAIEELFPTRATV